MALEVSSPAVLSPQVQEYLSTSPSESVEVESTYTKNPMTVMISNDATGATLSTVVTMAENVPTALLLSVTVKVTVKVPA